MSERFEELRRLQEEHNEWSQENFGDQPYEWTLLGLQEELGELAHSELKMLQGIRLDEEDVGEEATKDAVGDIIIYLLDFCNRRDLVLADCLDEAALEVLNREWDSDVER